MAGLDSFCGKRNCSEPLKPVINCRLRLLLTEGTLHLFHTCSVNGAASIVQNTSH